MDRQEQFEIWVQQGLRKWEMLASFADPAIASALAQNRKGRTRLICVTCEQGRMVSQEMVEEVGFIPLDRRSA
jgi:hypothetical protein